MTFDVTEPYDVQDLSEVKEIKNILPVTKGLKVRINKASAQTNKAKDIYSLKLELRIVDGLEQTNPETGETKMAYINKPMFTGIMDLVYGAKDVEKRDKPGKSWWKNNQHLVGFTQFCKALGLPLKGAKIDDDFFANLIGKEVLVDVVHEEDTIVDALGDRVKAGTFREKLKNWNKVA